MKKTLLLVSAALCVLLGGCHTNPYKEYFIPELTPETDEKYLVYLREGEKPVLERTDDLENAIYGALASEYVCVGRAGFIGAPQMNMVNADVVEKDGLRLEFCGQSIRLDENRAKILRDKGYVGKKITLGIRPEDLHDAGSIDRANKDACIHATIRVYEMLGAETYLYFDMDQATWTARVDPSVKVKPGETVDLYMNTEKLHAFDVETELAIFN